MLLTDNEMLESHLRQMPQSRKCSDWSEAEGLTELPQKDWNSLQHFHDLSAGSTPFNEVPDDLGMLFILHRPNGKTYLVNTEGFNYCRYIIECKLIPQFVDYKALFETIAGELDNVLVTLEEIGIECDASDSAKIALYQCAHIANG